MKHIIDIETWERRDNYNFFRNFHNSWISITSEVDCTEAFPAAKSRQALFFSCITCMLCYVLPMK